MSERKKISYLVPRDPSIMSWSDRVKFVRPHVKPLFPEVEETIGDNIEVYLRLKSSTVIDCPYTVLDCNTLQTEAPKESVSYKNVTNGVGKLIHKFTFTSILDQDKTQAALFKKCAVKNLKNFLLGENFLLIAYGTTCAGKTFTMQGDVEHPGIIPRALNFIFNSLKDNVISACGFQPHQHSELLALSNEQMRKDLFHKNLILSTDFSKYQKCSEPSYTQTLSSSGFSEMYENVTFKEMQINLTDTDVENYEIGSGIKQENSYKYSVWVSMIEIYNEQVFDLLEIPNRKGNQKLMFGEDELGNPFVKNLRYINVSSGHEAFQVFQFGKNNLHIAPTALNERSSRSHCIFIITLAKFLNYEISSEAVVCRFSLCDLAGMERAKKTLNTKHRLVESKAINTSLSIFVKCLKTIKENQNSKEKKMIPFRESKLTKLFRNAVIGKERFSLIVNVTPEPGLFDETLNVLKFSSVAQKIVPQNIFVRPKFARGVKRSRFSRIVENSSNVGKTIDWAASAVSDVREKNEGINEIVKEDEIKRLREEISQEIEANLRQELTAKFLEILTSQYETSKKRFESNNEYLKEMYEKKEERIVKYFTLMMENERKKFEDKNGSCNKDQEKRLKEQEDEIEKLNSENETFKHQVQSLTEENKSAMTEITELKIKILEKEMEIQKLQKIKGDEAGGDARVEELRKQLEEANTKTADFIVLLDEAASDYKELEETNENLRKENEKLDELLTEHSDKVADLTNEILEVQKLLHEKQMTIEKLEDCNENLKQKLESKDDSPDSQEAEIFKKELETLREQLKETSENLSESRAECEILRTRNQSLEQDLEISSLRIIDLENKILSFEKSKEESRESEEVISELQKEKQILQTKCNELNDEIEVLQKELKGFITTSNRNKETTMEIENLNKEILYLKKNNSKLEEDLKKQTDIFKSAEGTFNVLIENMTAKLKAIESQNAIMKNQKDKAEHQATQLHEEIQNLQKEIDNRDNDLISFNENREVLFKNYEKEMVKLKEENERLRKDVFYASQVIAKNLTPLKSDQQEINRLKESVKKKDEEIVKLKAQVDSINKEESDDSEAISPSVSSELKSDSPSSQEDQHFVNIKKKPVSKVDYTAGKTMKEMNNLTLPPVETRSTRKKVNLLHESIHPSTVKKTVKEGKKKSKKEKEKELEKTVDCDKENIPIKKKGKCYKQLFTENDFDGLTDLNASPLEDIPRLRPRK